MSRVRRASSSDQIRNLAKEKFGFDQLRPGQEKTIQLVLEGHDTLSIMPTGSGKSAIYQLAGLLMNGPVVVVSPLLALQKDQKESIEERELAEVAVVNSTQRKRDRREAFEKLDDGSLKFMFCAPEQLANEETRAHLQGQKPALFVVDEAHCVSEWGQDFRPDYARLGSIIEQLGKPPILALTATASPNVREEIVARLGMKNARTVVWGFDRPNISLGVESCEDDEAKDRVLLWRLKEMEKPAIVYVATHRHAEEVSRLVCDAKIACGCYHGGMKKPERDAVQDDFMTDKHEVIVATNAFGMGVDKPNVRTVIHYDIPESLDSYYQEVGRAGRDGNPSKALLLYRPADVGRRRAQAAGPRLSEEVVEKVEQAIEQHVHSHEPVTVKELKEELKGEELSAGKVAAVVGRLSDAGAVEVGLDGTVAPTGDEPDDIAEVAVADQEKYRKYRLGRVELMKDYAESEDCRARYVLNYFGETTDDPCGRCDNCKSGVVKRTDAQRKTTAEHPYAPKSRVRHKKYGEGVVLRYEADKIEVQFDEAGPKELVTAFVVEHDLLEPMA